MKTRMHPSIILEKLISSFVFILLIAYYIISQMLGDLSTEAIEYTAKTLISLGLGMYAIGTIIIIVLLLIFTFIFWISWKNTYLSFDNESLVIERGKLFKKVTTIHLADIATINIKRNILEKILGTSNLKIDLNTNEETYNGKLIFKQNKAIQIKNEILSRMGKEIEKEEKQIESTIKYTTKDVIRHMFLSTNVVSLIILITVAAIILGITFLMDKPTGMAFALIPTLIIVVPVVWEYIKSFLSYYNFNCTREEDNIKLSYGALTTYKYSIPIKKINSIIIHQTLQARILGYYLIEVVNAGIGSEQEEKRIISLYVKEREKNIIMHEILPEYQNKIKANKGNKNVLKHYLTAKLFWIILGIIIVPLTNFISLIIIPITILIAYGQYRTRKIGNDDTMIIISNGILNKKEIMTKYSNIEVIKNKQKLLSKLFKTRSLQINVVGPTANSIFISGLFKAETINTIINNY